VTPCTLPSPPCSQQSDLTASVSKFEHGRTSGPEDPFQNNVKKKIDKSKKSEKKKEGVFDRIFGHHHKEEEKQAPKKSSNHSKSAKDLEMIDPKTPLSKTITPTPEKSRIDAKLNASCKELGASYDMRRESEMAEKRSLSPVRRPDIVASRIIVKIQEFWRAFEG